VILTVVLSIINFFALIFMQNKVVCDIIGIGCHWALTGLSNLFISSADNVLFKLLITCSDTLLVVHLNIFNAFYYYLLMGACICFADGWQSCW